MDFGFGDWMGDDDLFSEEVEDSDMLEDSDVAEEEEEDEELLDTDDLLNELDEADAANLEDAALVGGLFGAANEKDKKKEKTLEDLMNPLDAKDLEILSDKGMGPIYRDNPEFARLVWDTIHEDMKEADQELMKKVRKMKEK